jgi:hypothetical protein
VAVSNAVTDKGNIASQRAMEKMELKLKNNYMAKQAFIKTNPNKKHAGG